MPDIGIGASYALDITDQNREQIFKDVYNLIEFLREKGFGYIDIRITFYVPETFKGKTVKQAHDEIPGNFIVAYDSSHLIIIEPQDIKNIRSYKDIANYFGKTYEGIKNDLKSLKAN